MFSVVSSRFPLSQVDLYKNYYNVQYKVNSSSFNNLLLKNIKRFSINGQKIKEDDPMIKYMNEVDHSVIENLLRSEDLFKYDDSFEAERKKVFNDSLNLLIQNMDNIKKEKSKTGDIPVEYIGSLFCETRKKSFLMKFELGFMGNEYVYWNPLSKLHKILKNYTEEEFIEHTWQYFEIVMKVNYFLQLERVLYCLIESRHDDVGNINLNDQKAQAINSIIHSSKRIECISITNLIQFENYVMFKRINKYLIKYIQPMARIEEKLKCLESLEDFGEFIKKTIKNSSISNNIRINYCSLDEPFISIRETREQCYSSREELTNIIKDNIDLSNILKMKANYKGCNRKFTTFNNFYLLDFDATFKMINNLDQINEIQLYNELDYFYTLTTDDYDISSISQNLKHEANEKLEMMLIDKTKVKKKMFGRNGFKNILKLSECKIFYTLLVIVNSALNIQEIIKTLKIEIKDVETKKILSRISYLVHKLMMDNVPLLTRIINYNMFGDREIKNCKINWRILKPIDDSFTCYEKNLKITKELYKLDYIKELNISTNKINKQFSRILKLITKSIPIHCKVRQLDVFISKIYGADIEITSFINVCVLTSIFGMYPHAEQGNNASDFIYYLKTYKYIYYNDNENLSIEEATDVNPVMIILFRKIVSAQNLVQNIIREYWVTVVNEDMLLKRYITKLLFNTTNSSELEWNEFTNTVINNANVSRNGIFQKIVKSRIKSSNVLAKKINKTIKKDWVLSKKYRIHSKPFVQTILSDMDSIFKEYFIVINYSTENYRNYLKNVDLSKRRIEFMLEDPDDEIVKKINSYKGLGNLTYKFDESIYSVLEFLHDECGISDKTVSVISETSKAFANGKSENEIKILLRNILPNISKFFIDTENFHEIKDWLTVRYYLERDVEKNFLFIVKVNNNSFIKSTISMQKRYQLYLNSTTAKPENYLKSMNSINNCNEVHCKDKDSYSTLFDFRYTNCCKRLTDLLHGASYGNFSLIRVMTDDQLAEGNQMLLIDNSRLRCINSKNKIKKKTTSQMLESNIEIEELLNIGTKDESVKRLKEIDIVNQKQLEQKSRALIKFNNNSKTKKRKRKAKSLFQIFGIDKTCEKRLKKDARKLQKTNRINLCDINSHNNRVESKSACMSIIVTKTGTNESFMYRHCTYCGSLGLFNLKLCFGDCEYICHTCYTNNPKNPIIAYCDFSSKYELIHKSTIESIIREKKTYEFMSSFKTNESKSQKKNRERKNYTLTEDDFVNIQFEEEKRKRFKNVYLANYLYIHPEDYSLRAYNVCNKVNETQSYFTRSQKTTFHQKLDKKINSLYINNQQSGLITPRLVKVKRKRNSHKRKQGFNRNSYKLFK